MNRMRLVAAVLLATALTAACGASEGVRTEVAARNAAAAKGVTDAAASASDQTSLSTGTEVAGSGLTAGDATAAGTGAATGATATGSAASSSTKTAPVPTGGNGGATDVGVSATSIKIGGTFFNGGFLDKYSQVSQQAAAAYFNFINDQGGIFGRKISFSGCDTAGQAQGTASCVNKFINDDKVFALGPSLDFNLDTVPPLIEKANVPWVGTSGLYAEEFTSPLMFPTQLKGADVGAQIMTFAAKTLGVKTVGVSWVTIGAGRPCLERARQVATALGASVIVDAVNEDVNNGLSSQVDKIKAANPDAVLFCNDPVNTVKFIQAAGSKGYKAPKGFVGGFVAADDVPEAMGRAGVGVYGFSSYDFYKADTPALKQYREITEFYYPRIFHHFYTQAAYTGAVALVDAIRAAGPQLTRAKFLAAMRANRALVSMGLAFDFANEGAKPSGIMLQADENLRWKQVSQRFAAAA